MRPIARTAAVATALLAGFAVMGLELTAVRLLAPHFGDSAPVWTNVIGVMLLALAAGAWLGGRLAAGTHSARRLAWLLGAAAAATTAVPVIAPTVGAWLVPQALALENASATLVRGSLAATAMLFALPVGLAGCATPMLVAAMVTGGEPAGRASGAVAAAGTLGSLVGTFATTHLLVPYLGSRTSVWICAAALWVCAGLLAPRRRGAVAAAALVPVLGLLPWPPLRLPGPGEELLAEVESVYQYLQVVRSTEAGRTTTSLRINEGLDSFHSVAVEGTAFTGGRYYDYYAVLPFLAGDGRVPAELQVLSLGAGAGTFARLFAAAHPGSTVDGVELDPAAVRLGERWFGGRVAPGRVWTGMDARMFVEVAEQRYHVVLVDTYEHQIYVPAHVASRQFFGAAAERLRPGGVLAVNAGGRRFEDPVVVALARTMATVFGESWAFRVPRSRNFMLVARRGARLDPGLLEAALARDPQLRRVLAEAAAPGAWRRFEPGPPVLDDDRPLLDVLQEQALATDLARPGLLSMDGKLDPKRVEQQVRRRLEEKDYQGALSAVQQTRAATTSLRLLAGDTRWYLHDLAGARAEYAAAFEMAQDSAVRQLAAARIEAADAELVRRGARLAARTSPRNGWIALVSVLGAGVAFAAVAYAAVLAADGVLARRG